MGERGIFLPDSFESRLSLVSSEWIIPPPSNPRNDSSVLFVIQGPFSGGKTKLGMRVKETCQQSEIPCIVLEEQFAGNPHLAELNVIKKALASDPTDQRTRQRAYFLSHASEKHFLEEKRQQVEQISGLLARSQSMVICLEAAVFVDPIYAWAYWVQDLMTEQDLQQYLYEYQLIQQAMPPPDMIFAITVSRERLIQRHRRRLEEDEGRTFEEGVPPEELAVIADISNMVTSHLEAKGWPMVNLDTNLLDYVYSKEGVEEIHQLIHGQIEQSVLRRGMPGFGNF